MPTVIPQGYESTLGLYETQKAIGLIKQVFLAKLCSALHLKRVTAPLFVDPALGLNDGPDRAHEGFEAFTKLLDQYRPGYFVHGHVHLNYGAQVPRTCTYGATQVVNAYERFSFEAQLPFFPPHAGRGR